MADTTRTPEQSSGEPVAFDDRTRRVLELRRQVREGTYRPDAHEIARALLREWAVTGELISGEAQTPSVETAEERKAASGRFLVEPTPRAEDDADARTG